MRPASSIEISEHALRNNLAFLQSNIGKGCKFSAVVKGNAYGHGIKPYVALAYNCGVDHFSVFSASEALQVHEQVNGNAEIMIMGLIDSTDMDWAITKGISFFVFDQNRLEAALQRAKELGVKAKIHLELDTGMNRTGLDKPELLAAVELLHSAREHFELAGVCTHFAGAESFANHFRIQKQIREFNKTRKWLNEQDLVAERYHTACSAAAMNYPKTQMDMVRIGIMQYGYWPNKETMINWMSKRKMHTDPLIRIITWKSHLMSKHHVKKGEFIGYGTRYLAEEDMLVAVVPVGYAQGYSRSLSDQGRVLVNGQRVGVIGMVNMNMVIIDITRIPEVCIGDEVILIGEQGDQSISVSSFSELSAQLNYELLTRLPLDIPRKITM